MGKEILCHFLIEPAGKSKGDRLWEHQKVTHTLSPFHKILSTRNQQLAASVIRVSLETRNLSVIRA